MNKKTIIPTVFLALFLTIFSSCTCPPGESYEFVGTVRGCIPYCAQYWYTGTAPCPEDELTSEYLTKRMRGI